MVLYFHAMHKKTQLRTTQLQKVLLRVTAAIKAANAAGIKARIKARIKASNTAMTLAAISFITAACLPAGTVMAAAADSVAPMLQCRVTYADTTYVIEAGLAAD